MPPSKNEAELSSALRELKECTHVTMETVGVRCQRRVNTTVYKKGLNQMKGQVIVQPPNEDRVSVFTSLQGGRQASIKLFSTGKIRCLKSDFKSQEHAQQCAQGIIDEMSKMPNSGMPRVTLSEAKFHANAKDLTWSTRQAIGMRLLIPSLQQAGIRAESDTSFGDSVMVIISPKGSERQIKGQVLADGTIRLAGCRGDGPEAARAVVGSLNDTGCMQGGQIDLNALKIEVWLTKRHFHVCGEGSVINMDALHSIMSDKGFESQHPILSSWAVSRAARGYNCVQSVSKVGSACPRLEIKFLPVTIEEWEQVKRKPEPVSISIHHRGEVQLAGNAEYKVLQGYWFVKDVISRHSATLIASPSQPAARAAAVSGNKGTKRKLEVVVTNHPSSPPSGSAPVPTPPTRRASGSRSRLPTSKSPKNASATTTTAPAQGELPKPAARASFSGQPMCLSDLVPPTPEASLYHMQQMFFLTILRQHCALIDAQKAYAAMQSARHLPQADTEFARGTSAVCASSWPESSCKTTEDEKGTIHQEDQEVDTPCTQEARGESSPSHMRLDEGCGSESYSREQDKNLLSPPPFATPSLAPPKMNSGDQRRESFNVSAINSPVETPPTSVMAPTCSSPRDCEVRGRHLNSDGRKTPLSPHKQGKHTTSPQSLPRMSMTKLLSSVNCDFDFKSRELFAPSAKKPRLMSPGDLGVFMPKV